MERGTYSDRLAAFNELDKRAADVDLHTVASPEVIDSLRTQAERICLDEGFLRREALLFAELPEDHIAKQQGYQNYVEERMLDIMSGGYSV